MQRLREEGSCRSKRKASVRGEAMIHGISNKLEIELRAMVARDYSIESIQNWCANKLESEQHDKEDTGALQIFSNARDELLLYLDHLRRRSA